MTYYIKICVNCQFFSGIFSGFYRKKRNFAFKLTNRRVSDIIKQKKRYINIKLQNSRNGKKVGERKWKYENSGMVCNNGEIAMEEKAIYTGGRTLSDGDND